MFTLQQLNNYVYNDLRREFVDSIPGKMLLVGEFKASQLTIDLTADITEIGEGGKVVDTFKVVLYGYDHMNQKPELMLKYVENRIRETIDEYYRVVEQEA
jgi:hypothetical protein